MSQLCWTLVDHYNTTYKNENNKLIDNKVFGMNGFDYEIFPDGL